MSCLHLMSLMECTLLLIVSSLSPYLRCTPETQNYICTASRRLMVNNYIILFIQWINYYLESQIVLFRTYKEVVGTGIGCRWRYTFIQYNL